jgi:transposase
MKSPWYKRGVPPGKVVSCYRVNKSTRKVAQILGMSPRTVASIIRAYNPDVLLPVGGEFARGKKVGARHLPSAMAEWIRAHPDTKFPRSLPKIMKMTGLSADTIKSFFYRLRKQGKDVPLLTTRRKSATRDNGNEKRSTGVVAPSPPPTDD